MINLAGLAKTGYTGQRINLMNLVKGISKLCSNPDLVYSKY